MRKVSVLWIVVTLASIHLVQVTQGKQPNIVFVMADDYGYHDIGYHGSDIRTPTLDTLSATGVRLENYYVQPVCTPTRSQLMSGRYQIHTGLQHRVIRPEQPNALPIDSDNPTLADKLREAGYATHMVGKWHLGFYRKEYLPINRGFDTFYGMYNGGANHFSHKRWSHFFPGSHYLDLHDQDMPVRNESGHYSTHLYTSKAIERIMNNDPSKPFFLYLSYQAVHRPLQVPASYIKPYRSVTDRNRRIYSAMVSAMDEGVANVTKALRDSGHWNNTILIFSSDNGGQDTEGANNYPLRGKKASLFEGGIRAIGFVVAPHMNTTNTVSKELMHISDWYPTIVGLAGGSINGTQSLDGCDQWNTISEGAPSPRSTLLHNIDSFIAKKGAQFQANTFDQRKRAAIRHKDWKLITGNPGPGDWNPRPGNPEGNNGVNSDSTNKNLWLYNITADPSERTDLSMQNPNVVRQLLDMLLQYEATAVPVRFPKRQKKADPSFHGNVWGPWQ